MRLCDRENIESSYWYSFSDEPILARSSIGLSDPAFLLPEESPDGLWHMFVHTWIGVEHLTSTSGLEWKKEHLVKLRAHSPFIFKQGNVYYLFYEIHSRTTMKKSVENSSSSRIMVITSTDLLLWSEPRLVLDSAKITRAQYKNGPVRISRPQVIEWAGVYRLYFGAGETRLFDTNEKATARLMYAESDFLDHGYRVNPEPVININGDDEWRNLAVGSVHIVPLSDCVAAFECAFSYDKENRKSTTNVLLLVSDDGINFDVKKVIQKTPLYGWSSRYIRSVDVRYKESEKSWYCYYSASGVSKYWIFKFVRESLGLILGAESNNLPS